MALSRRGTPYILARAAGGMRLTGGAPAGAFDMGGAAVTDHTSIPERIA